VEVVVCEALGDVGLGDAGGVLEGSRRSRGGERRVVGGEWREWWWVEGVVEWWRV